jgi:hypothetical protein
MNTCINPKNLNSVIHDWEHRDYDQVFPLLHNTAWNVNLTPHLTILLRISLQTDLSKVLETSLHKPNTEIEAAVAEQRAKGFACAQWLVNHYGPRLREWIHERNDADLITILQNDVGDSNGHLAGRWLLERENILGPFNLHTQGDQIFQDACERGELETLKWIISCETTHGPVDPVHFYDDCLRQAAVKKHEHIAEYLMELCDQKKITVTKAPGQLNYSMMELYTGITEDILKPTTVSYAWLMQDLFKADPTYRTHPELRQFLARKAKNLLTGPQNSAVKGFARLQSVP